jgi:hypothetical protein
MIRVRRSADDHPQVVTALGDTGSDLERHAEGQAASVSSNGDIFAVLTVVFAGLHWQTRVGYTTGHHCSLMCRTVVSW